MVIYVVKTVYHNNVKEKGKLNTLKTLNGHNLKKRGKLNTLKS